MLRGGITDSLPHRHADPNGDCKAIQNRRFPVFLRHPTPSI